jgi:hypothetical protein
MHYAKVTDQSGFFNVEPSASQTLFGVGRCLHGVLNSFGKEYSRGWRIMMPVEENVGCRNYATIVCWLLLWKLKVVEPNWRQLTLNGSSPVYLIFFS